MPEFDDTAKTGQVIALRACRRYMQVGRLILVERTDGNTTISHIAGHCPVHETRDCVETYYAAGYLAQWSWRGWLTWRRAASRTRQTR